MKAARITIRRLVSLLISGFFTRQLLDQLRSEKVRPRGSKVDRTREDNPWSYWSAIGTEIVAIALVLYIFSMNLLKTVK